MKYLKLIFNQSNSIPRWLIFVFDLGICATAFILSVILRYSFKFNSQIIESVFRVLPIVILVKTLFMTYFRLYSGIVRHTGVQDGLKILYTTFLSSSALVAIDLFYRAFSPDKTSYIPLSIIVLDFIISAFLLAAFRITVKIAYLKSYNQNDKGDQIVFAIFGAGEAGITTKKKLDQHRSINSKVSAFFDDNPKKIRKSIDGIEIYNFEVEFENICKKSNIDTLILTPTNLSKNRKQEIIEKCLSLNVNVRTVPPVEKWINGELSFNQIKSVNIEDLIERDTIELDKQGISKQIDGKVVMVTGAAGSIGSEMVNQILKFRPKKLLAIDSSEIKLYDLEHDLLDRHKNEFLRCTELILADIGNVNRMRSVFEKFRPEIVYHAAAYKHVPLMESNPSEAIKTNVGGTKNIADLSVEFNVEKFVMVSTDKAVNPTNVMGASKRIAEIYVQSLNNDLLLNQKANTKFITTRFGNVLGSSGSVIPKFRKQINEGGPITVTHPEITRYFMTIPEACQLVLEAGFMGKGGEIFVFDMGKSVKIIDLAKKMVKLSGLTLGKDINIAYTGLRPGEKIYEELLNDQENTMPTHHPKIMIGKVRLYNFEEVTSKTNLLLDLYNNQNQMAIVAKMKEIVPEFLSKNSIYESLDKKIELSAVTVENILSQ
ncbi:MAG: nucleoside-diphosphate sugar epimerase/dehydratase [Bacteroidetes bacterium]|nr:nucleoside-diphosphate sugar epimerase/dehydratase [Bacteroidota bacterium]